MRSLTFIAIVLLAFVQMPAFADDAAKIESKISVTMSDAKISDVLDSIVKQSGQKILVESSVKGQITLSLNDVSLETALGAVCDNNGLVWRKLYIASDSKLLEQPDRLASTVRLMAGMSFPDIIVSMSSNKKIGVYSTDSKTVTDVETSFAKQPAKVKIYLITNDSAVVTADKKEKSAVDEYADITKKAMELFMKMTPEEQEKAIMAGISQYEQMTPEYMASTMRALMNSDPEVLRQMNSRQTEMLFSMPAEQRRSMIKLQMTSMSSLTPEQMQIIQEDAAAVAQEMKEQAEQK